MTTKSSVEREQKQSQNKQSLNGALAEVLKKSGQKAVGSEQKTQKSAAALPPREAQPAAGEPPQEGKKPFEVPEDALRKVLKGES